MIVLGLDTSTQATAAAVRLADGQVHEARDDPPAGAHPGHATRLLGLAAEALERSGARWGDITRIAAGIGPGTFTGLRVGIATARGLAQSLAVELVGVSSLQALAEGARAAGARYVLAVIDARRGEVFAGAYELLADGVPRELAEPRALAPALLGQALVEAGAGHEASGPWLAVGDGALRYPEVVRDAGVESAPEGSPLHRVGAAAVCALALAPGGGARLHEVVPDYRRAPDAELALQGSAGTAESGRWPSGS